MEPLEEYAVVASVAPIVRIAHTILTHAIHMGASVIYIEPEADRMDVCFQFGEDIQRVMRLPAHIYPRLVTRYKVMAEVSWASRDQPATGHFTLIHNRRYYDVAVSFPRRLFDPRIIMTIQPGADAAGDDEDEIL